MFADGILDCGLFAEFLRKFCRFFADFLQIFPTKNMYFPKSRLSYYLNYSLRLFIIKSLEVYYIPPNPINTQTPHAADDAARNDASGM